MQLALSRSEHGWFWRTYSVSALLEVDELERAVIYRHGLHRRPLYLSPQKLDLEARAAAECDKVKKLSRWHDANERARKDLFAAVLAIRAASAFVISVGHILNGVRLSCADLDETLTAEHALIEGLDQIAHLVTNARTFETRQEQLYEPDHDDRPQLAAPATWVRHHPQR